MIDSRRPSPRSRVPASGLSAGILRRFLAIKPEKISSNRLRWLTIVFPLIFIFAVQALSMIVIMPNAGNMYGHAISVSSMGVGVVLFSMIVFGLLDRMERRIVRQNEELSALNAVSTAVSGSLKLEVAAERALGNVMAVTRALAGEIVVESDIAGEAPYRFAMGRTGDLEEAGQFPDLSETTEVQIRDGGDTEGAAASGATGESRTYASVPLRAQNQTFGVMRLVANGDSHLTSEGSERLLAAIGSQIGIAIQASHLYRDVARRAREAQTLYRIGLNITSLQDTKDILHTIVEDAREMLGSESASLCLDRGMGDGLVLSGRSGRGEGDRCPANDNLLCVVSNGGRQPPTLQPDESRSCPLLADDRSSSQLGSPLVVGQLRIGEFHVSGRPEQQFTERHRQLLASLADMAAIAINNARLFEGERHMAVLEERQRLAREMHDSLAQVLGYLHLKSQVTARALDRDDVRKAREELDEMTSMAHEAYLDVRAAILDLRETVSPATGIVGALGEYVKRFKSQTGIDADMEFHGDELPVLAPAVEVQLLRVIQEAMTNVRKHANASRACVRVTREGNGVCISVEDDGQGFDAARVLGGDGDSHRFGVQIMRERVERVGGRFEIETHPGQGTTVRILLSQEREVKDDTD